FNPSLFLIPSRTHRYLHSFPTRRSSDLLRSRVRFTELNAQGDSVGEPRELSLDGDEIYVDALVIKFEDTFVTAGDVLKGKALLLDRKSTRLNSSHVSISYAVFCLKKKKK